MPHPLPSFDILLAHEPMVRGVACAILRGDPAVDDVVQDTWLAALQSGSREVGSVGGWLRGVARHRALNVLRDRRRRGRRERRAARDERMPDVAEIAETEEMRRRLMSLLLSEREPYRTVLLLRYYENLPPREVAARLGVPIETAKTRIKRALARLRLRVACDRSLGSPEGKRAFKVLAGVGSMNGAPAAAVIGGGLMGAKSIGVATGIFLLAVLVVWGTSLTSHDTAPGAQRASPANADAKEPTSVVPGPSLATAPPAAKEEPRLLPAGAVHAVVVDSSGAPVADVVVLVVQAVTLERRTINDAEPDVAGSTRQAASDDRGRFGLARRPDDDKRLLLVRAGHEILVLAPFALGAATSEAPRIELADGRVIEGRVVASDGVPVEGARISAYARSGSMSKLVGYSVAAQADGRFRFQYLPMAETQLSAGAKGYATTPREVSAEAGDEQVVIELTRSGLLVQAVDAETGCAVPQAGALLQTPDGSYRMGLDPLRADEGQAPYPAGWLMLRDVKNGFSFPYPEGQLFVVAPGYRMEERTIRLAASAMAPRIVVRMHAGPAEAGLAGRVTGGGQTIRIEVRTPRPLNWAAMGDATLPLLAEVVLAEDGAFATGELPAGPYRLVVVSEGAASKSLDVVAPRRDLMIELAVAGTIAVLVSPPAQVWVHMERQGGSDYWSAETDAQGRRAFPDLPAGHYRATVTASESHARLFPTQWPYVPVRADVDLAGGSEATIELARPVPRTVELVVVDEEGATREGVRVKLSSDPGSYASEVQGVGHVDWSGNGPSQVTGADGRAFFELFPGAYGVDLQAGAQGRRTWIDVKRGEASEHRLVLFRKTVRLAGRVLDEDSGLPITNRRIEIRVPGVEANETLGQGRTDDQGRFRIEGVPAQEVLLGVYTNLDGDRRVLQDNPYGTALRRIDLSTKAPGEVVVRLRKTAAWLESMGSVAIAVSVKDATDGEPVKGATFVIEVETAGMWVMTGWGRMGEDGRTGEPVSTPRSERYRLKINGPFGADPPYVARTVERQAEGDGLVVDVALEREAAGR